MVRAFTFNLRWEESRQRLFFRCGLAFDFAVDSVELVTLGLAAD
jgi:hypothetical protein